MEKVQKSRNFAAIIRSCDAVGIHGVYAVTENGELPKHHMTSAGANKWVKVQNHRDIETPLDQLRSRGFQILAAHVQTKSIDFREADYTRPTAIVMGSELYGISRYTMDLADHCLTIPMQGLVESLNVSVAAALILYEARRQREANGMYKRSEISQDEMNNTLFEWCYPQIAEYCRRHQKTYPALDDDGYIVGRLSRGCVSEDK